MYANFTNKALVIGWRLRSRGYLDLRGEEIPQATRALIWCFGFTPSFSKLAD